MGRKWLISNFGLECNFFFSAGNKKGGGAFIVVMNIYRRMKEVLLAGWLLLLSVPMSGQTNVEIRGTVEGGAGKQVLLGGYADMLTLREEALDSAVVADDGSFALRCYANYPRLVFVEMECYSQSFYIEPGRTYEVYVPPFDWDLWERHNVFLDPVALPVEFLHVDSTELNVRIMRYEEMVDSFVGANRERLDFRFKPDRKVWSQLQGMVEARFRRSGDSDSFFVRYVEYNTLEMGLAMRMDSRKRLAERYIVREPIRYHDESYMRFFFSVFEHSIADGTRRIPQWRMAEWVRDGMFDAWIDSLGLDPLLENEQVRELAALQALKEMFYDKRYDREGVRRMAGLMAERAKFADHRRLAQSLLASFDSQLAAGRGHVAATFALPDADRHTVSLDEMRGKWVYLSFVRVGDPNSLKEIETMAHFRDTVYGGNPDVRFVTVVCDREFQKMYHFLRNGKKRTRYNWTWLHFDGNYRLLERYGVSSYPTFVLIAPDGRQVYDYTPSPASGILLHGPWEKAKEEKDYGEFRFEQ